MPEINILKTELFCKTEYAVQKEIKKQKVLVGKIIPYKGHSIWEVNNLTLEVRLAKFIQQTYIINQAHPNPEILVLKDHSYVSALNKESALKKYLKGSNGSKKMGNMEIKLF
jgi:hypothetical protein